MHKATVKVNSQNIKEMDSLTKFILYAVKQGEGIKTVAKITKFDKDIIREDFEYLLDRKLLSLFKNKYKLTETGKKTYQYIKAVEDFNDNKQKVLINKFSREITKDFSDLYNKSEINKNGFKLKENIVTELYFNINPENLHNLMINSKQFSQLKESEKENLEFSLYINWDLYYKKMNITNIPKSSNFTPFHKLEKSNQEVKDKESIKGTPMISIKRYFSIFELYFKLEDNDKLNNLKSLHEQHQKDDYSADEEELKLIKEYLPYYNLSKKSFNLFLDELTGEIGIKKIIIEDDSPQKGCIELESEYSAEDISLEDKKMIIEKFYNQKDFNNINLNYIKPVFKIKKRVSKIFDYPVDNLIDFYITRKVGEDLYG